MCHYGHQQVEISTRTAGVFFPKTVPKKRDVVLCHVGASVERKEILDFCQRFKSANPDIKVENESF